MNTTATPDSQRVVPVEPTDEMVSLALSHLGIPGHWREDARPIGTFYPGFTADESEAANWKYHAKDRVVEAYKAMLAAAPVASPAVAPLAAAQERVSCWRLITPVAPHAWIDGLPPTRNDAEIEAEKRLGWSVELAYSRPPAQTQGGSHHDENGFLRDPAPRQTDTCGRSPMFDLVEIPATPEARRDGDTIDWLVHQVRGDELRRIEIDNSAGCTRAALDAAQADHEGV